MVGCCERTMPMKGSSARMRAPPNMADRQRKRMAEEIERRDAGDHTREGKALHLPISRTDSLMRCCRGGRQRQYGHSIKVDRLVGRQNNYRKTASGDVSFMLLLRVRCCVWWTRAQYTAMALLVSGAARLTLRRGGFKMGLTTSYPGTGTKSARWYSIFDVGCTSSGV